MATIEDFHNWLKRDLTRFGEIDNYVSFAGATQSRSISEPPTYVERAYIFTDANKYAVTVQVHADDDDGYLGCVASSRKPRAGEDWTRGNDLADGSLSEETWHKILGDIVSYEMVRIRSPKAETQEMTESA